MIVLRLLKLIVRVSGRLFDVTPAYPVCRHGIPQAFIIRYCPSFSLSRFFTAVPATYGAPVFSPPVLLYHPEASNYTSGILVFAGKIHCAGICGRNGRALPEPLTPSSNLVPLNIARRDTSLPERSKNMVVRFGRVGKSVDACSTTGTAVVSSHQWPV